MSQATTNTTSLARGAGRLPAVLRTVAAPVRCMTREAYAYTVESASLSDELRGLGLGGGGRCGWN